MLFRLSILSLALVSSIACGRTERLIKDAESCKKDLTSSQYMIDHLKERLAAPPEPKETEPVAEPAAPENDMFEPWEAAFVDIAERVRRSLTDVEHEVSVVNGALVVSLNVEQLFPQGEDNLHDDGGHIVHKLAVVLKTFETRHILILCRSSDVASSSKKRAEAGTNRDLAMRRSLAVISSLEWREVDPALLIVAAQGIDAPPVTDEDAGVETKEEDAIEHLGVVEFHILPRAEELPPFPEVL